MKKFWKKFSLLIAAAALSTFCFGWLEFVHTHPGYSYAELPQTKNILLSAVTEPQHVLVVPPDAPDRPIYSVTSGITTFLAYGDETKRQFSLFRDVIPPGREAIPHLHTREDEFYYLVEGTAEVVTGSQTRVATAGNLIFLPKGKRHGFKNIGSIPLKMLVAVTPAGFEGFFADQNRPVIDRSNPPPPEQDLAVIGRLSQKYGTQLALDPNTPSLGLSPLDFIVSSKDAPGRPSFNAAEGLFTFLATAEETGGQFSLIDVSLLPQSGGGLLRLMQQQQAYVFYVLEGEVKFQFDGETMVAAPGTTLYFPHGKQHAFQNNGTSAAKMLSLLVPSPAPKPATAASRPRILDF